MLLRLFIYRSLRYIIPQSRIAAQPPAVFCIQVSCTVLVESCFFVSFLSCKLVRQIDKSLVLYLLLFDPDFSVRSVFYSLIFITSVVSNQRSRTQVVRVVEELLVDFLVNCRLVPCRKLRHNPRLASGGFLPKGRSGFPGVPPFGSIPRSKLRCEFGTAAPPLQSLTGCLQKGVSAKERHLFYNSHAELDSASVDVKPLKPGQS